MADEVNLKLNLDDDDAIKSLKEFDKAATSAAGNISKAFNSLKTLAVAAVAALAAKEVVVFFKDAAAASAASEAEIAKLTASLKSLGEFTPEVVQGFKDFANEIENTSKFSDDAVISQIAFVKQLGLTDEKAKELVQAAADLASVTGDTLDGAVAELGKTLTGTAGALKKTIPEVGALTEAQLKAGAAVDLVANRLKGAARESIQTYQGSLIQLANAQEDFQKSVGEIITQNPAFIKAIQAITSGFNVLEGLVRENQDSLKEYAALLVEGLVNGVGLAVKGLKALADAFSFLAKAGTGVSLFLLDLVEGFTLFLGTFDKIEALKKKIFGFGEAATDFADKTSAGLNAVAKVTDKTADAIAKSSTEISTSVKKTANDQIVASQASIKASVAMSKATILENEKRQKLNEDAKKFLDSYLQKEKNTVEGVIDARDRELASLKKFADAGVIATDKAEKLRQVIVGESESKILEFRKKALEDFKKDIGESIDAPFSIFVDKVDFDPAAFKGLEKEIGASLGVLQNVFQGGAGAESLVKGAAGAIADAFLPGTGKAVAEITGALAKGPVEVKKMIDEFTSALPQIIINIVEAIPVALEGIARALPAITKSLLDALPGLIKGLVDAAPAIIQALAEQLPTLIQALIAAIPDIVDALITSLITNGGLIKIGVAIVKGMLTVATSLGKVIFDGFATPFKGLKFPEFKFPELPKLEFSGFPPLPKFDWPALPSFPSIPTPGWVQDLINALSGGKIGDSVGGFFSDLNPFKGGGFGFAQGGLVPAGFPNDTFPAPRLTSGELVVDRSLTGQLQSFLNNQSGAGGNSEALLTKIVSLLQQPMTVDSSVNVNQREFANIILQLNRQNARLA